MLRCSSRHVLANLAKSNLFLGQAVTASTMSANRHPLWLILLTAVIIIFLSMIV
jgi:hypothetical protein